MYRVLREGTEEAYSNLDFSPDGTMLASVGCAPDFMLTVWDWKNEKILLRYKAFAQDIYKVAFSPDNEGHVNTSGSGHIRYIFKFFLSFFVFIFAINLLSFFHITFFPSFSLLSPYLCLPSIFLFFL